MIKKVLHYSLNKMGVEFKRYPDENSDLSRRLKIVKSFKIDVLLDVGANSGHYAQQMRSIGFDKKIVSFEPLKSVFKQLELNSSKDPNWHVENYAIGNEDVTSYINVAGNTYSSSLLNMLPSHLESAPESKFVAKEQIEVKKLDSIYHKFSSSENRVMLKIDTQGYEKKILEGAINSLNDIYILQLEMSIIPLYQDEMIFTEMISFLDSLNYQLFSLENGFSDLRSGRLLQVDGVFVNRKYL